MAVAIGAVFHEGTKRILGETTLGRVMDELEWATSVGPRPIADGFQGAKR